MRCARCGYVNAEGNRFCGMCGGTLVAPESIAGTGVGRIPATATRESVTAHNSPVQNTSGQRQVVQSTVKSVERAEPAPVAASSEPGLGSRFAPLAPPAPAARPMARAPESSSTVITGPSFLGLNRPAEGRSSGRSADDLDYLLEEEEEPRRGWGKLFAVVMALALLGGFGYLRWKQGGFDFVTKLAKPATTSQGVPDAAAPATTPTGGPPESTSVPASSNPILPVDGSSTAATGTPPAGTAPDTTTTTDTKSATTSSTDAGTSPTGSAAAPATEAVAPPKPAANESDTAADAESTASVPKPAPAKKIRQPKPSPVLAADNTAQAERYIYGRGVRQDCDEGLRLLKPAAPANPKAAILLGSLYSSGTCAPRDLPTAYRWFAMALHKQPDNSALQDDLKKLWGQMTPPERQLAIRLSQ